MPIISFSYLISMTMTSRTMLNRSGENGHACLVSETFKHSILSKMLTVCLLSMAFIMLRHMPSILNLLIILIMKGC